MFHLKLLSNTFLSGHNVLLKLISFFKCSNVPSKSHHYGKIKNIQNNKKVNEDINWKG